MNEVLYDVLMVVVIVVATLITRYLVPYFKSQLEDAQLERAADMVAVAVRAAEQTMTGMKQGKAKKAEVVAFVSHWLAEHNIHITEDQLDNLIEAAVYVMNEES